MDYKVKGIVPLQPIIVQYSEDEEDREDLFFLSPENGALVPGFGEGEGPKDPQAFGAAFMEGWKKFVESKRSRIVTPVPGMPPPPQPPQGGPASKSGLII